MEKKLPPSLLKAARWLREWWWPLSALALVPGVGVVGYFTPEESRGWAAIGVFLVATLLAAAASNDDRDFAIYLICLTSAVFLVRAMAAEWLPYLEYIREDITRQRELLQ